MSLYDRYFSKINEDHMFQLIIQIMVDETGKKIEREDRYHQIFKERLIPDFFQDSKEDFLSFHFLHFHLVEPYLFFKQIYNNSDYFHLV